VITCAEAVTQLWEYLDHALPQEDRERVQEHLSFCRTCCGEVEFAQELQKFMTSNQSDQIPSEVRSRLETMLASLREA
jgi:anti-sigma factor (TIGR02949 family)